MFGIPSMENVWAHLMVTLVLFGVLMLIGKQSTFSLVQQIILSGNAFFEVGFV